MDRRAAPELELPGFRFHPTEEELLEFYLKQAVHGKKLKFDIIPTVHLYRHDPRELPGLAKIGEREWYFFVPRDRRQANGGRPSRTTERGFWKATGSDRAVRSATDPKRLIGLKKTLVYYEGRAPRGTKTDWVMNEYRLPDNAYGSSTPKEDIVLCKIYRKAVSLKELEQRVAMEEIARSSSQNTGSPVDSISSTDHDIFQNWSTKDKTRSTFMIKENEEANLETVMKKETEIITEKRLTRQSNLPQLEVPNYNGLDWMQDPFLTQLRSPWMENWSPCYASVINF